MATRMQQRKGTEAQWISTNNGNGPVLNAGEIGYETDTNKFKIGDGINHWVDLNYFADEVALGGNIDDYIPLTQRGTANGVATLNGDGVIPSSQIPSLVGLDTEITAAVDAAINSLIDGAPAALNTLNELAAAVNDDSSFASSVTTALNAKAPTENPTFTGVVAGVTKTHVGLGNVDNTSDADKPVSTAVATELALKLNVSEAAASAVESVYNKLDGGTGIDITQDGTSKIITVAIDSTVATETYADDAAGNAVDAHNLVTTNVHGIDDTADLVTLAGTQELTNKTITDPTIKIGLATVSSAELGYLDGLTTNVNTKFSDIDTALGTKVNSADLAELAQDAVGGSIGTGLSYDTVTNILSVDNTAFQARVANVSDTEIGYLNGVTSAIQTQIDAKAPSTSPQFSVPSVVGLSLSGGFNSTTEFLSITDNGTTAGATHLRITGTAYDGDYAISSIMTPMIILESPGVPAGLVSAYSFPSTFTNGEVSYFGTKTISATEISHLDGVTSGIQEQINAKSPIADPTFTGTATTNNLVVDGDFTVNGTNFSASATSITIEDNMVQLAHQNAANTVDLGLVVAYNDGAAKHAGFVRDVSDAKWKLFKGVSTEPSTVVAFGEGSLDDLAVNAIEAVDATFTGTVTGVTKSMVGLGNVDNTADADKPVSTATQTALDAKSDKIMAINAQTSNYTLTLSDVDDLVEMNVGSANTLTVPANADVALPVGTRVHIVQTGSGQTTLTPGSGVTINATPGLKTRAQWSAVTLVKRATNTWVAFGDLTA